MALTRYSSIDLLEYPNCQGLSESGRCLWLSTQKCLGAGCPFVRLKGVPGQSDEAWQRLRNLNEAQQQRIAEKYYGGQRPWVQSPKADQPGWVADKEGHQCMNPEN